MGFLPAALEIQERPPLPASRAILWTIMAFFTAAVTWSCIGHVDIVAVAPGKIVPSTRVKRIQPLRAGVVSALHVREGEQVRKGDLLVEMDATQDRAELEALGREILHLELRRSRLRTLIAAAKNAPVEAVAIAALASPPAGAAAHQRSRHVELARAQFGEYLARLQELDYERSRLLAERATGAARLAQLEATLPLISEHADALKALLSKALAARVDWLGAERARLEHAHERDVQRHRYRATEAALRKLARGRDATAAAYHNRWLAELAEVEARLSVHTQQRIKAERNLMLQRFISPVAGEVQQLAVHTVGGVVTPAQTLMLIVPAADAMEIEAYVRNRDIGFVHEGQEAAIKVDTFPFTKYGTLTGTVAALSEDAIEHQQLGFVYRATVQLEEMALWVQDKLVDLAPGMTAAVEIKLGKRRIIEFLLSPLLRYGDETARER